MFIYYSTKQARKPRFQRSWFFVVLGVDNNPERQGWAGKKEDATRRIVDPLVVVRADKGTKKDITSVGI